MAERAATGDREAPVPPAAEPVHVVGLLGGRPVGDAARVALAGATLVAGGGDQLAAVADLLAPGVATVTVGAGLGALEAVAAHAGPACVLASGDPGFHGVTRSLAARIGSERLVVHPAPSSVSLAFARLGLPWDAATVASCHAGGAARAAAVVAGAARAAVLCGPAAPPQAVGAALAALGAHPDLVAVATRLGEPGEAIHRLPDVAALAAGDFDHRSVVVLAHGAPVAAGARVRTGGRPTAAFAHRRGMITKPEVRSVVLGGLDLPDRGVLWDVGAGSGSVGIEAALAAPRLRVVAVERDPDAAATIVANAAALGAMVEVVAGAAPEVLAGLPRPDRIFVGGGGLDVLDACLAAVAPGGRVVATYAAADRALAARARLGTLAQVSVDRAADLPDGGVRFVADNPVFVAWGDVPADPAPADRRPAPAAAGAHPGGAAHAGSAVDRLDADERVVVGVGCSSGATADEVAAVVADALGAAGCGPAACVATVDRRADHPAVVAAARGIVAAAGDGAVVALPATLLAAVDVPDPSAAVAAAVGTPSVAEAAALLAAGPGARLVVGKQRGPTATAAVAVGRHRPPGTGLVRVVGLGPGAPEHRTPAAVRAVRSADAVVGYGPYVDAVAAVIRPDQFVLRSPIGAEATRADQAVALAAAGWTVAVVSSGDPGTFAMASVTLEAAARPGVPVEVVPGVTAASAGAAAAGAPLAGPYAALTLSDILVPWPDIAAQLRAAAASGLAIALFNPRSGGRPDHLARARDLLVEVLDPATPVAVVTDATGPGETTVVTTLGDLDPATASMRSIVLVGTAETVVAGGRVVTRRHHPRPTAGDRPGMPATGGAAARAGRPPDHAARTGGEPVTPPVHPIEADSYRILAERVDLDRWPPLARAVVARVIHASADVGYADTLVVDERACAAGVAALRTGAPVVSDVDMVAVASRRAGTVSLLAEGRERAAADWAAEPGLTVSAAAMRVAAERWPSGAVVAIGNAPTALAEVVALAAAGCFAPALVIGLPVGFVGAAEAKAALRASGLPSVSNIGERGGSAVAAATLNALWRLSREGST